MAERIDRVGQHKTAFQKNKRTIFATQDVCALCGAPVDKSLKAPDPMSPNVDHIIPIAKGGHPSSLDNLQLTHRWCNLHKGDKLFTGGPVNNPPVKNNPTPQKDPGGKKPSQGKTQTTFSPSAEINNDDLPLHADWSALVW